MHFNWWAGEKILKCKCWPVVWVCHFWHELVLSWPDGRLAGQACVCKEPEECPEADGFLCVALGDGSEPSTMTECEVGMLRCHGEPFTVTSVGACATWCCCCSPFSCTISANGLISCLTVNIIKDWPYATHQHNQHDKKSQKNSPTIWMKNCSSIYRFNGEFVVCTCQMKSQLPPNCDSIDH